MLFLVVSLVPTLGCVRVGDDADLEARANLDHWNALDTTLRQVNAARGEGAAAQLEAIRLGIETLDRLPTDGIDPDLLELNESLRDLLHQTRDYLASNAPLEADPTDHPGPLHEEEAALVEEGIRVQLLLTERYDIAFPQIFDRSEQFDQQQETAVETIDPPTVTDPIEPE